MIINPKTSDRGSYQIFVGYFAVTPWNNVYNGVATYSQEEATLYLNRDSNRNEKIDTTLVPTISNGMSIDDVIGILGDEWVDIGSGTVIQKYVADNGDIVVISYIMDSYGVFRVSNVYTGGQIMMNKCIRIFVYIWIAVFLLIVVANFNILPRFSSEVLSHDLFPPTPIQAVIAQTTKSSEKTFQILGSPHGYLPTSGTIKVYWCLNNGWTAIATLYGTENSIQIVPMPYCFCWMIAPGIMVVVALAEVAIYRVMRKKQKVTYAYTTPGNE